jgi:tape measure domain-containing protein
MSVSIGRVAYIATWDATSLTKGVLSAQQMFREQKKITQAMQSPLEKYVTGLGNLQKMSEKYPDIARQRHVLEQQLELTYLKQAKAVRVLTDEETRRLKALSTPGGKAVGPDGEVARLRKAHNERVALQNKQMAAAYKAVKFHKQLQDKEIKDQRDAARKLIKERYAGHKAAADLDKRRQKKEEDNVRLARKALEKRLHDRKRYNIQMRQEIRNSVKYHQEENAGFLASGAAGKSSGAGAGGAAAAGALGGGLLAKIGMRAGLAALPALAVNRMNALNNSEFANMHRDLERTKASLTVFSGSLERSNKMLQEMRDLSAQTGVSFAGFTRGARTLLQFGMNADLVLPMMKQITIVTGGNAERMESLSLAMAQVNAAGKLMGQELIQSVNAGWTPANQIMKEMNWNMGEFRRQMELGNISSGMVFNALKKDIEAGGLYFGFLEELEGSSARTHDRMMADWEQMSANVGESISPITDMWNKFLSLLAKDVSMNVSMLMPVKDDNRLQRMEESFSRIRKSGHLTAETMQHMKDAGFDPAAVIMKEMQWSAHQFKEKLDAGRVSALLVANALKETGKYTELLAKAEGITVEQFNLRIEKERKVKLAADQARMKMEEMEAAREENRQAGIFAMPQLQFDVLSGAGAFTEQDLERFNRYVSLMDEAHRNKAVIDFASHRNINSILGMLDDQLQIELKQLDAMEDKAKAAKKFEEIMENSRKLNAELTEDPIVARLAELEIARSLGQMTQATFDKAATDAVAGAGGSGGSTTLASKITQNSQDAYRFLVGSQDRTAKEQMKVSKDQKTLQEKMVKALERANELLDEIADGAIGPA